ncbi:MAG: urate hydroxylase PuuD, partial [Gaiellaceae bacterium]
MAGTFLDPYVTDWLNLLFRWLHVIAAMAWIGASFYFVLLDQSLEPPKKTDDIRDGVGGELWEVHGGGFYHVKKYKIAPPVLPEHLAWFKWEAYTTWLSGFALMVVLYYVNASAYLIDPEVADLTSWQAVGISLVLLVAGWVVYDVLCRGLIGHDGVLWLLIVALSALASWGCTQLFQPRAAFLQVGAMLGTIMAGNVFFNIIPAHRELIRAKRDGREPDPTPGIVAKQRSVHNNYLTLPVLFTMIAGHFAFTYGAGRAWVVLLVIMLLGAWARLFYNL